MCETVQVNINDGGLRGKYCPSQRGGNYYSFQGIPYAKPPVGDLRFKAPAPVEPWKGVKDALREGPSCPSVHLVTFEPLNNSSEDCLYLNVYTPKLPKVADDEQGLAVLFWIHGGGFSMGSGDTDLYGPDYLITENVVLVTINYRLGPLGFLKLSHQESSGNNGMKDIILALKWVKSNISKFCGNPENVTIFGESAGGSAVDLLMISPLSKGLFHKAIAQSGCCLNQWAFTDSPHENALELAKVLGCSSQNENEVLTFLKSLPVEKLVIDFSEFMKKGKRPPAFVPCLEEEGTIDAFLTRTPNELSEQGHFHDVPYIIGTVSKEGHIMVKIAGKATFSKEESCYMFVPKEWLQLKPELLKEVIQQIQNHYFKEEADRDESIIDAISYPAVLGPILKLTSRVLQAPNRSSPTFCYWFSFSGNRTVLQTPEIKTKGAAHCDELAYLFHGEMFNFKLEPGTRESQTIENMTKLWTNFAKTGNPTPTPIQGVTWQPATEDQKKILQIDDDLKLVDEVDKENKQFWDKLTLFVENNS